LFVLIAGTRKDMNTILLLGDKKMVDVDKGFSKEERENIKDALKDSVCFFGEGKCSMQCIWLAVCDKCDDEGKMTPFCRLSFEDVVYGDEVRKDIEGDDVCSTEYHFANYGEVSEAQKL